MLKKEAMEKLADVADQLDEIGLEDEANRVTDILEKVAKGDKWIPEKMKSGRFTEYCKKKGYDGPCDACANDAMKSDDASVRGMAQFWRNVPKKQKKKKK